MIGIKINLYKKNMTLILDKYHVFVFISNTQKLSN